MSFLGSAGATCPVCRSLAQVAQLPLGPLLHSPPRLPELLSQPSELLELVLFLFPDVAITRYHDCRPQTATFGWSVCGWWDSGCQWYVLCRACASTILPLLPSHVSAACIKNCLSLRLITACLANVKMYFVVWASELEYECRLVYS